MFVGLVLVFVGGDTNGHDLGRAFLLALMLLVGGVFCEEDATLSFSSLFFAGDEDGAVDTDVDVDVDDDSAGAGEVVQSAQLSRDESSRAEPGGSSSIESTRGQRAFNIN